MNLARGAGLRGLAGIPPVRGAVQRPLIQARAGRFWSTGSPESTLPHGPHEPDG